MPISRIKQLLTGAFLAACSSFAAAQSYPTKPVSVIVPFAAGGTNDIVARIIAQELSSSLGKQVVVENRTGGGGVIGWGAVAKAPPDGHTLLATDMSFAIAAGLLPKLQYDPKKDFVHISTAASVPFVMVVHPSVDAKSVAEFVALAKASPGKLNYGSGGNGTNTHLGGELFKSVTGTDIIHVPYKGSAAALQDLLGGQVQALFTAVPTALPHVKAGKLRALMVTSEKRVTARPEVPSAPEAGVPKMIANYWVGFSAPAKTPQQIVDRLHKEIVAALNSTETKKRFTELGLDPVGNTPAEAAKLVEDEIQRWSALIKAANIKAD
jgi:tripartite-type tricarboxylate transporter receptor subunit TctC